MSDWTVEDFWRATEAAGLLRTAEDEAWWSPARIRACQAHYEQYCLPRLKHWKPLRYYQARGIPDGMQWHVLGDLAARYARDFTISELADELFRVMEASPQRHGHGKDGPWTRSHAVDIAARAHRFIEREDAEIERWMPGFLHWLWCATKGRDIEIYRAWQRRAGAA